jgi:phosphoribosylanthranilate isomerase
MFRIKICGITNVPDVHAALSSGADAIGLNFYANGKRFIDEEAAFEVASEVPEDVTLVGVFVNSSAEEIAETADRLSLDAIQLHGDEPADLLPKLPKDLMIVRAYRCGREGLAPLARFISECSMYGRLPDAALIDADASSDYGGTGQIADWQQIASQREILGDVPLVLAGGLTPVNVGEAISMVRPQAVDVATGVERRPGVKDPTLVAQFVASARLAFDHAG